MTITRCSSCDEPAHASETDDLDRCATCRRPELEALACTIVRVRPQNGWITSAWILDGWIAQPAYRHAR